MTKSESSPKSNSGVAIANQISPIVNFDEEKVKKAIKMKPKSLSFVFDLAEDADKEEGNSEI